MAKEVGVLPPEASQREASRRRQKRPIEVGYPHLKNSNWGLVISLISGCNSHTGQSIYDYYISLITTRHMLLLVTCYYLLIVTAQLQPKNEVGVTT